MATAAVIGLSTGKRLLSSSSSSYYSDITEKLLDHGGYSYYHFTSAKKMIVARKSSNFTPSFPSSNSHNESIRRALREHVDAPSSSSSTAAQPWFQDSNHLDELDQETCLLGYSVEALLLLQKSMLEKQWSLSFERNVSPALPITKTNNNNNIPVTCSGVSARQRRISARKKTLLSKPSTPTPKHMRSIISPDLLQNRFKGYVKGVVPEDLLTHAEVVRLSQKIKIGLSLEDHKARY